MEKIFLFVAKIYIVLSGLYAVYLMSVDWYIYPKIAVYFSKDGRYIKDGCAEKLIISTGRASNTMVINGKIYSTPSIYLSNKDGKKFPIYEKRNDLENDLKLTPNQCHKIKYISIIDIGFWKRFYLYDYIKD